jgi:hypothetical protein
VAAAVVRFRAVTGTGSLGGVGVTLDVATNETGVAQTNWTLDGTTGIQVAEAQLLGANGQPAHLPIRFTARISTASAPAVLRLNDLRMLAGNTALRSSSLILPNELSAGIRIACSAPVSAGSIARALSCYVTLYTPFPVADSVTTFWNTTALVGYVPVVVNATVSIDPANSGNILWQPVSGARDFLTTCLTRLQSLKGINILPARLTIRGNFILPASAPFLSLDAEGFLDPTTGNVALPTGRGRPGGDLELDFWFAATRGAYSTQNFPGIVGIAGQSFAGIGSQLV